MKSKVLKKVFVLFFMFLSLVGVEPKHVDAASTTSYYSSASGLTGTPLLEELANISKSKHTTYTTYEQLKTMCVKSDPAGTSNFRDFYSGLSIPGTWDSNVWNREHVWCQSHSGGLFGETGAGADIHHIRPLLKSANSSRNNSLYGEIASSSGTKARYINNSTYKISDTSSGSTLFGYLNGNAHADGVFEPLLDVKGDIARILMYVYMHYSKEVSANSSNSKAGALSITNIVYTSSGDKDDAFDLLVKWNNMDPVDTFESNRNEYCYSVTGVRNPFIDNPEYADAIWGDGNSNSGSSGSTDTGGSSGSDSSGSTTNQDAGSVTITTGTSTTTTQYRRLKSATGIQVGDKLIIAAKNYNYALNGNVKTNNHIGRTSISKSTSGTEKYLSDKGSAKILAVAGSKSFTINGSSKTCYTLSTGSGYLASKSDSEKVIQIKTSVTNNAYWYISFSDGAATMIAQGSYAYNQLRFDSSSTDFTCYKDDTTGNDVEIYQQETTTSGTSSYTYYFPTANSELSLSKANEVASYASYTSSGFTPAKYKVTGTVKSIENTSYGNMTIEDSFGNSLYIYGVYNQDGTVRYDALNSLGRPEVGDTVTLYGILGTYSSTQEMKNAWIVNLTKQNYDVSGEMNALFSKYVGDGEYTKKTSINFNDAALVDVDKYFFVNVSILKRTTYYNGNALLMANYDGTLNGVNSTTGVNSGYGTNSEGEMTHFIVLKDGTTKIDYTVKVNGGMEGFYVTPKDFAQANYFTSNWKYDGSQGFYYELPTVLEGNKYMEDFIDVVAPLLLDQIYLSNYLSITKLVVKEVNNTLVLQIIVGSDSSGVLTSDVQTSLVLAEAIITPTNECNYTF